MLPGLYENFYNTQCCGTLRTRIKRIPTAKTEKFYLYGNLLCLKRSEPNIIAAVRKIGLGEILITYTAREGHQTQGFPVSGVFALYMVPYHLYGFKLWELWFNFSKSQSLIVMTYT